MNRIDNRIYNGILSGIPEEGLVTTDMIDLINKTFGENKISGQVTVEEYLRNMIDMKLIEKRNNRWFRKEVIYDVDGKPSFSEPKKIENKHFGYFLLGCLITTILVVIWLFFILPLMGIQCQSQEMDSVNAFTLESICTKDCAKFNSTSLLTFSYLDNHWHCSCENEGNAVTLW